ncbi:hypothetical protein DFH09DRAFT_1458429 [Mycena vulgaris]|nr:hypothetical protein DFH09DRAFT_1458429 [Mycena vulgaris]
MHQLYICVRCMAPLTSKRHDELRSHIDFRAPHYSPPAPHPYPAASFSFPPSPLSSVPFSPSRPRPHTPIHRHLIRPRLCALTRSSSPSPRPHISLLDTQSSSSPGPFPAHPTRARAFVSILLDSPTPLARSSAHLFLFSLFSPRTPVLSLLDIHSPYSPRPRPIISAAHSTVAPIRFLISTPFPFTYSPSLDLHSHSRSPPQASCRLLLRVDDGSTQFGARRLRRGRARRTCIAQMAREDALCTGVRGGGAGCTQRAGSGGEARRRCALWVSAREMALAACVGHGWVVQRSALVRAAALWGGRGRGRRRAAGPAGPSSPVQCGMVGVRGAGAYVVDGGAGGGALVGVGGGGGLAVAGGQRRRVYGGDAAGHADAEGCHPPLPRLCAGGGDDATLPSTRGASEAADETAHVKWMAR